MKKLTFEVNTPKNIPLVSLIKGVNEISCRIKFDFENGIVTVEDINDAMIDAVIDLIDNHYSILKVDIDNTVESVHDNQFPSQQVISRPEETAEVPQTEDDLIIQEVELQNESVNTSATNKVIETVEKQPETVQKNIEDVSKVSKESTVSPKKEETAILETIGVAIDKLDKSKPMEDQLKAFLAEIGMNSSEKLVTQSFIVACNISKINYENVISELHDLNPNIKDDIIKASLKEVFKGWLKNYPELAEKCPKISLMSILKVFAKNFSKA